MVTKKGYLYSALTIILIPFILVSGCIVTETDAWRSYALRHKISSFAKISETICYAQYDRWIEFTDIGVYKIEAKFAKQLRENGVDLLQTESFRYFGTAKLKSWIVAGTKYDKINPTRGMGVGEDKEEILRAKNSHAIFDMRRSSRHGCSPSKFNLHHEIPFVTAQASRVFLIYPKAEIVISANFDY
ncbi:MAG: hypothetical protein GY748_22780 [Planctomycetaceae bacterium]|nr:hypothetical protein [Planctomycetaceae bacterium]